jgi:hypothetical protein
MPARAVFTRVASTILLGGLFALPGLLAGSAAAQWRRGGAQVADEPWRRSDGDFGAMLVVTDRLDRFLGEWAKPDAPGHPPTVKRVSSAKRGDVVWGLILFSHCAPDRSRRCRAEADFTVLRPDGSTYATHDGAEVWRAAPPPRSNLQLATARLGFHVEKDDPLGTYRIRAVVKDLEAKRSVTLEQTLEVRAAD